jgi:hypothetical protein
MKTHLICPQQPEREAHEVAAGRPRDRLAERGLADASRADQAQDRPGQLVDALLDREVFDPARDRSRIWGHWCQSKRDTLSTQIFPESQQQSGIDPLWPTSSGK